MNARDSLLRILSVHFVFRFAILFRNGEDAQALERFEWVVSFCVHRANENRYVVANIQNGKRCRCAYQNAFE